MSEPACLGLEKLSLAIMSGDFERVHYGLVMASGALAVSIPVTLFFTMGACRVVLAGEPGRPGWHDLDGDPVGTDATYGARGIGRFEELLEACSVLGGRFIVCEMGLRAINRDGAALRPDLPVEIAGVVTLLGDAVAGGGVVAL